jgi:hypothetical protein
MMRRRNLSRNATPVGSDAGGDRDLRGLPHLRPPRLAFQAASG